MEREEPGGVCHIIVEVYYDDDGKITGWTQDAIGVYSCEGVEGVKWTLQKMIECLDKPVLIEKDLVEGHRDEKVD